MRVRPQSGNTVNIQSSVSVAETNLFRPAVSRSAMARSSQMSRLRRSRSEFSIPHDAIINPPNRFKKSRALPDGSFPTGCVAFVGVFCSFLSRGLPVVFVGFFEGARTESSTQDFFAGVFAAERAVSRFFSTAMAESERVARALGFLSTTESVERWIFGGGSPLPHFSAYFLSGRGSV